jgi:hypothetical protein
MDPGDFTQLVLVATVTLVLGRIGLAFARLIERRGSGTPELPPETEDRIRALERDLAELQERQDFTERALLQDPTRASQRIVTPR